MAQRGALQPNCDYRFTTEEEEDDRAKEEEESRFKYCLVLMKSGRLTKLQHPYLQPHKTMNFTVEGLYAAFTYTPSLSNAS